MSLETEIEDLSTSVAADVRDHSTSLTGIPSSKNAQTATMLNTTANNIVAGINELLVKITTLQGAALSDTDGLSEGSANLYFAEARVLATVLTGLSTSTGALVASDTVQEAIQKLNGNLAAVVNDAAASTTTTYSSTKIAADIEAAKAALVDGAPGVLDTINEIAAAMGDDANFATTMTNALALKANIANTKSVLELGATVDTKKYSVIYTTARDL